MKSYDIAVIGAGLGGLSASIHAATRGYNTILLEQHSKLGGKAAPIVQKGFTFDPGPSIVIMKWVYDELFQATGASLDDYLTFDRLDPLFVLHSEAGKTLKLPALEKQFLKAIRSLSEYDYQGMIRLLEIGDALYPVVKQTFFARSYERVTDLVSPSLLSFLKHPLLLKPYKSIVDELFQHPLLRAWMYSFPTYTGQTYHDIAPGALLIPYIMIREGVWYPMGGIAGLVSAFETRARELGVTIKTDTKVQGLAVDNHALITTKNREQIKSRYLVSNIDRFTTRELLNDPVTPSASYSYATVQLGISKKIKTLYHHTSCIPNDYEYYYQQLYDKHSFPDNPILYIHTPSRTHTGAAPKSCESVFVVIPTHAEADTWKQVKHKLQDKVISLLEQYNISIKREDILVSRTQTPEYFQQTHGNWHGSLFGGDKKDRVGRVLPHGIVDSDYKSLVYCGGGVQPGAGMPMVTLSGKFAIDHIESQHV